MLNLILRESVWVACSARWFVRSAVLKYGNNKYGKNKNFN